MKIYRKNIVSVETKNDLSEFYILPAGIALNKYEIKSNEKNHLILNSLNKDNDDFSKLIKLDKKPLSKTYSFITKRGNKKKQLRISLVYENEVLLKCINIINKEHYKPSIPQGLFIALFDKSEVIGVIVFSKLTYTNPKGRKQFFSKVYKTDEEIKSYGLKKIGWISRIVISKAYQSDGYGTFFAKKFIDILLQVFPNGNLEYIEVLTSWTLDDFKKKGDKNLKVLAEANLEMDNDFLCSANYHRVDLGKPSIRISKRGLNNVQKVIQYYYVIKIAK